MTAHSASLSAAERPGLAKWTVWLLLFLTAALAGAAPRMAMNVLFAEIVRDLNLNLVQVGAVWGAETLTGTLAFALGGTLSDRYGSRTMLVAGCVIAGLLGIVRSLAPNFAALWLLSLCMGPFIALIIINLHRMGAQVFPPRQLAIANGGVSVGMAMGFVLGAFTAARYLSPAWGGWRNVLMATGTVGLLMGLIWAGTPRATGLSRHRGAAARLGMKQSLLHVARLREVRLICYAVFGYGACVEGVLGYLSLYLRNAGWAAGRADLAVTAFHVASMVATLPASLLSDRLGRRRSFLVAAAGLVAGAAVAVPLLPGETAFGAMLIGGLLRDAFMSIFITRLMESEGVGPAHAGSALGLAMMSLRLGGALAPPLGNSLAGWAAAAPFYCWALFCALPIVFFLRLQDRSAEGSGAPATAKKQPA